MGHSCPIDFFLVKHVLALVKLCTECLCLQMSLFNEVLSACHTYVFKIHMYDIVYENIPFFVLVM